jgi:hypothetical protein
VRDVRNREGQPAPRSLGRWEEQDVLTLREIPAVYETPAHRTSLPWLKAGAGPIRRGWYARSGRESNKALGILMTATLILALIGILGSGALEILLSVVADLYADARASRKMLHGPSLLPSVLMVCVSGDELMQATEATSQESGT